MKPESKKLKTIICWSYMNTERNLKINRIKTKHRFNSFNNKYKKKMLKLRALEVKMRALTLN